MEGRRAEQGAQEDSRGWELKQAIKYGFTGNSMILEIKSIVGEKFLI